MDITIIMSRARARKFFEEGLAAAQGDGPLDITEYAKPNGAGMGDEVTIQITNDDMERDEVAEDIFVDVD